MLTVLKAPRHHAVFIAGAQFSRSIEWSPRKCVLARQPRAVVLLKPGLAHIDPPAIGRPLSEARQALEHDTPRR